MDKLSFWKDTAERSVKTFAQTLVALWTVSGPLDIVSVDWKASLGVAVGAAVVSVLTSLASSQVGPNPGSPSAV
jgi:hypothetical protein